MSLSKLLAAPSFFLALSATALAAQTADAAEAAAQAVTTSKDAAFSTGAVSLASSPVDAYAPDAAAAPAEARGPEPVAPIADRSYAVAVNRRARGLGIGFHQGLWGSGFGQSLRLEIPFGRRIGQFFGARLSANIVHGGLGDRYDPVAFGGVELFGRSPVIGGVVRVFGGGGVFLGGRFMPEIEGRRYGFNGGGHMGIEAFASPRLSFSVEVGGQGPVHALGLDGGASVMGGANFWFGR